MTEQDKRLASSLKTPTGAFSEITAVSQRAINNGMKALLVKYPEIANIDATLKYVATLKAVTGQPLVALKVSGANRSQAEYYCKFSSGTLVFELGDTETIDVSGWTIAFDIDIQKFNLEEGSDEEREVKKAIEQPGDFSISSLFLAFNRNVNHSNFNGYPMTEDQTLYLGIIMAKWYAGADSVMNDRRKTTVLYALETRKPESVNELAPTFPPTALKFQTYEYIAPGHSVPDEGLEKGGGNMLLYLQMTEHKEFPKEAIINYSGNYVSSGMDATICIAREIFWDSYLLRRTTAPLLNVLNPYTYVWVSGTDLSKPIAPHWSLGMADPCHQVESTYYWEPSPDDPLGWKWEPKNVEQHVNLRNDKGGESCDVKIECTTTNTLKPQRGKNTIQASGKTDVVIEVDSFGSYYPIVWSYKYTIHMWITWSTNITLQPVENGGLKISLNLPSDLSKVFNVESDELKFRGDTAGYNQLDSVKTLFENEKTKWVNKMKNIPFGQVEKDLENNLANAARFVVPGGGAFTYKNPVFNDNADLMIEASYNI